MFSGSSNFSDLSVQASSFSKPLVWAASLSKLLVQAAGFSNFLRQAASFSSLLVQAAVQSFRCPSLPRKQNRLDVKESSTTRLNAEHARRVSMAEQFSAAFRAINPEMHCAGVNCFSAS